MTSPRRSPLPEERVRDAERTKAALLDAARAEFAAKGLAGARVGAIAERAGVNKQLISYYFGGKDGLYQAILQAWAEQEAGIADSETTLTETAVRYLRVGHAQPDLQRLFIRQSLDGLIDDEVSAEAQDRDLERVQHRQELGDLDPALDPGWALLFLQGMVVASAVFPGDARRFTGLDPQSPEFLERAEEQLRLIVAKLA